MKVFLAIGHGGSDPGATAFGMKEKDINLVIGMKCKSELERHGVDVVCSRTTDEYDPVTQEVQEANASDCDLAFAIHINASNGKGDGSESFYYSSNEDGKRLAELCEKYVKELGQNSRGIKIGDKLYFIRKTNMTAVLSEGAFIDNDIDNNIIDTKAEQEKFGVAYAKAILEYSNIPYKAKTISTNTSTLPYLVKINTAELNVRAGAGVGNKITAKVHKDEVYTIIEEKMNGKTKWGRLKSKVGWISLAYTKRI